MPTAKPKRDIAAEILHGLETLKAEALGQIPPLKRIHVQVEDKTEVQAVRRKLGVTQKQFAELLHINTRTLENWEQGRTKPNEQAAVLIKLVAARPELVKDLQAIR